MRNDMQAYLPRAGSFLVLVVLTLLSACGLVAEAPEATSDPATSAEQPTAASDDVTVAPTPTPTPLPPPELLARGLERRHIGDYEGAAVDFSTVLDQHPASDETGQARYYLAESFALRGRWSSSSAAFRNVLNSSDISAELAAHALFWLARSHEEMGEWRAAVDAYGRYRGLNTVLEPYAAVRQAALYEALGMPAEAAEHYAYVARSDVQSGERAGSYEKAIALRRQLGQDAEALQLYEELLGLATLPAYRASILSQAAELAEAMGQTDRAYAWLRETIAVAPFTPHARAAVDHLWDANDPALPSGDAARIYFNAERYDDAIMLLDQALAGIPAESEEALELRRLRAMALRGKGDFEAALDELAAVAAALPNSEAGRQARLDWIQTLGQSGEIEQAASEYEQYAATYPDAPRAPEALDRAAQLRERLGNGDAAMQLRLQLGQRYPLHELAPLALNRAGWYFYSEGRQSEARVAWEQLTNTPDPYEQARGAFWAGRVARSQQDEQQARTLFEQARQVAPNSYYGFRATEELGIIPNGTILPGAPITESEWQGLANWTAAWSTPTDDGYQTVLNEVTSSGYVQRAIALHDVGLRQEAINEWNSARDTWAEDPPRLMWLARRAHEHNMPYIALKAGEQLAALAADDAPPRPIALERMIFPTPYADLVLAETRAHNVDPRLFYALMRQESLFNPGATSWVGARGLAQVMPTTGEGIAQNLGVTNFQVDDLYRPHVSVRFGAFYIGQRLLDMRGSAHGALAAYNGGLGNAQRWAGGSYVADSDLFTEYIDFPETEGYVKHVYGFYGAYQRIYALP